MATQQQLRERWETPEGQERLKAVVEAVQLGEEDWQTLLTGFAFVEEVRNGRDLRGADLRGGNLHGASLIAANLRMALLHEADLSWTDLRKADLRWVRLHGTNLMEANFSGANLSGADFRDAHLYTQGEWNSARFDFCRFDEDTDFRGVDISRTDWTNNRALERHIKDMQWLDEWRSRTGQDMWGRTKKAALDFLWRWTCDYGRSVWRWVVCSSAIALVFAVIFYLLRHRILLPNMPDGETLACAHPFMCVYYSIVTFTTLGFGDVVPKPGDWLMQAIVVCEVILGYVMLGGLISLFTSKLARRS